MDESNENIGTCSEKHIANGGTPNDSDSSTSRTYTATASSSDGDTSVELHNSRSKTIHEALVSIPIIADFIALVILVNVWLNAYLPFYTTVLSLGSHYAQKINTSIQATAALLWIRGVVESVLITFVDFVRGIFPALKLPTREVVNRTWKKFVCLIWRIFCHIASYSWSQKGLHILEQFLKKSLYYVHKLEIKDGCENSWIKHKYLLRIYRLTVGRAVRFVECGLQGTRREVRALRRAGCHIIAHAQHVQSRRKVSPRKSGWSLLGTVSWMVNKTLTIFGFTHVKAHLELSTDNCMIEKPNKNIPSAEKKRKLSAVEECSDGEGQLFCTLLKDMDDYDSDEDSDYELSETSTDSYEYRSTDAEEEAVEHDQHQEDEQVESQQNLSSNSDMKSRRRRREKTKDIEKKNEGSPGPEVTTTEVESPPASPKVAENKDDDKGMTGTKEKKK